MNRIQSLGMRITLLIVASLSLQSTAQAELVFSNADGGVVPHLMQVILDANPILSNSCVSHGIGCPDGTPKVMNFYLAGTSRSYNLRGRRVALRISGASALRLANRNPDILPDELNYRVFVRYHQSGEFESVQIPAKNHLIIYADVPVDADRIEVFLRFTDGLRTDRYISDFGNNFIIPAVK